MNKKLNGKKVIFKQVPLRNKKDLKYLAELALIYSIPSITHSNDKNRLGSLYRQLLKVVEKVFNSSVMQATPEEKIYLEHCIGEFGKFTGWESNPRHISTVLSFSCALVERDERFEPRILEKLNLIIEYLERGGDVRVANCWAGSLALEKWDTVFEDAEKEFRK